MAAQYSDVLAMLALEDARYEVTALRAANARLRTLIADAEWEGNLTGDEPACPWCLSGLDLDQEDLPRGQHATNCPAFSAPGVVR